MAAALAAWSPAAQAIEPPNQNDPCSRAGRNVCDTLGVGRYETYKYGLRWFGDYRGAIQGVEGPAFCIDLRFWYPGKAFAYKEKTARGLKNRAGQAISTVRLRRMAYAMWELGRTNDRNRQAAMMLYVHGLMADGAPGEVAKDAIGARVEREYERIADAADKFAGPYKLSLEVPDDLRVGRRATASIEVRSASGGLLRDKTIQLDASGENEIPGTVSTGNDGRARFRFTPMKTGKLRLRATTTVASTLPKIFVPGRAAPARNGQRLAVPASATLSDSATSDIAPARLSVRTSTAPRTILLGEDARDTVTVGGAPAGWSANVEVRLYGPFRTREAIVCTGTPAATTTYQASAGESSTPPLKPSSVGFYGFQLTVPSTPDVVGLTTPCVPDEEVVKVETQPQAHTQVSEPVVQPGTALRDKVTVSGLAGEAVSITVKLFGPFPSAAAIKCDGAPLWTGTILAGADGSYETDPFTVTTPGYYSYYEEIAAGPFTRAQKARCAEAPETAIVRGNPTIHTQVSEQETMPGASITDSVVVGGLGAHSATVNVELWGPYATKGTMTCAGAPYATETFTANGDGAYTTKPVALKQAGYFTYRESIAATEAYPAVQTACGEATETSFAKAKPEVTTQVSSASVVPGSEIFDTVKVTGLGETPATVRLELYGPFASRSAISCAGAPQWRGTVEAAGDGTYRSERVRLAKAGFYVFRESIAGSETVEAFRGECAIVAETSLGRPLVLTGKGDRVAEVRVAQAGDEVERPTRVSIRRLGIDAPVQSSGIDLATGALGVPANIRRLGWWADGAAPGDRAGTVLIAGHVDSAREGGGAFFALRRARRGDIVVVTTSEGQRRYRVAGAHRVRKERLPAGIYTRSGRARLILVTCGGVFNTRTGHYPDNVVVTAFPA